MTLLPAAPRTPRILSIAGTDPTGGAGIQADLKSIGALGGYGMAVVTALVAQNTHGVRSVHLPPASFLREQLDAVSDDVEIDAVKIGMIATADYAAVVAEWLDRVRPPVVVLDPVMVSTSGHRLLDPDAEAAVRALVRRAHLVTPNLAELGVLAGASTASDWGTALEQASGLARALGTAVLVKGGHLEGGVAPDAVVSPDGDVFEALGERVATTSTHGTGCSLSSAMATLLAGRGSASAALAEALVEAKEWLTGALRAADTLEVGSGNGPIDHFHRLRPPAFCAAVWEETRELRREIDELPFVRALGDGSLDREDFEWYLEQDALYLIEYARVLAVAAQRAPTTQEQVLWAESSASALAAEAQLHRDRLGTRTAPPSSTTRAYLDHLLASCARGGYGEIVAALLPCFWLYADVGVRLSAANRPGHPYEDWLRTYADPAFVTATDRAIAVAEEAARRATPIERAAMRDAFLRSSAFERDFFAAPLERIRGGE
ncbi:MULTISPECIES: bifunctional hydroxymethylpyrimidine kinase/phosphomethylpyrimidine kinase [unclassified Rathayibacter]|uniref:bifunctional hydroxymethylpyrimidine kinase/phosphomethylpyrimidine kinase n=1 Tax=unclassified Rathayibacter TaxID=2609250 RepID=UPI00188D129D|nr:MULTISPECIES: bifunctional hydroxymethylpyrimidine kinase/phosphomethylpyrimidine kinase [unclassified Rathayibacter]MBF4461979.1 bifunctional hydroxymethylpyrimidine kinase/phosphomethylpyrimidine kinase [Rathayibacter sp. VKM Ac-2879]MBF4503978.1 bifunctional hydroxymethylpyrimidine kinase/phosphomethylpyrimidine kinase [Rathayibacter sp. VKM Ac-2878]